ncbi:MAG: hypothetical protein WAT09_18435 [Paracoccaceae bacterium]
MERLSIFAAITISLLLSLTLGTFGQEPAQHAKAPAANRGEVHATF